MICALTWDGAFDLPKKEYYTSLLTVRPYFEPYFEPCTVRILYLILIKV